ncbi:MAG TPA: helix-turn-helix domain-containing protein [Pirellulales bacterium]|nr:helix-turn-helix domain-containing protein [Pirellulales bacterium]
MLKVSQVASKLSLSVSKIYELIERRELSHHRMDGAIRVSEEQLAEYLERTKRERGAAEVRIPQRRPRREVVLKHL